MMPLSLVLLAYATKFWIDGGSTAKRYYSQERWELPPAAAPHWNQKLQLGLG